MLAIGLAVGLGEIGAVAELVHAGLGGGQGRAGGAGHLCSQI